MNCGDSSTARITGFMFGVVLQIDAARSSSTNAASGASVSLTNQVQSRRASRCAVSGWIGQRGDQIEAVLHAGRGGARLDALAAVRVDREAEVLRVRVVLRGVVVERVVRRRRARVPVARRFQPVNTRAAA